MHELPASSPVKLAVRTAWVSVAGNAGLAAAKGLAGLLGNSFALIADAVESTADIFSSLLVLFGLKYAGKPPDENHPYGHGRAEPLITFMVVGFLVAAAVIIAYESIENIRTPHDLPKAWTLIVLGVIIAIKETFYRIVVARSKETNSSSLKADAWHHRSDAITSLMAFIGISIAVLMGPGYESADDWAALAASAVIIYNSYKIFRPALGEIMDENFYDDLIRQIREISLTVPGVKGTDKCLVRKVGMQFHVDLHAIVDGSISVQDGHAIAHHLKDTLRTKLPQLADVLVHVEPD